MVKTLLTMHAAEIQFLLGELRSLGQKEPLEKEMANPFQYSCLGNPSYGLRSLVGYIPGVAESWTRPKELSMYAHTLLS